GTWAAFTVILAFAVNDSSAVVTLIFPFPAPFPVTLPLALSSLSLHAALPIFTDGLVAFPGLTVAVSWETAPVPIVSVDGETVTPVTETVAAFTVNLEVADDVPSAVVTVIVAVPAPIPVTLPLALTVATLASLV